MANYSMHPNSESDFEISINEIIRKYDIRSVVETGTWHGDGSTLVFAKTGLRVVSIECNPENSFIARNNLKHFFNVDPLWGYSLKLNEMVDFIKNDNVYENKDIAVEGDTPELAKAGYIKELGAHPIPENLLSVFGDTSENQIIFLDSAGGVGYAEFLEFLKFKNIKKKILVLDDVNHVKHHRSHMDLIKMGKSFYLNQNKRWLWCSFME